MFSNKQEFQQAFLKRLEMMCGKPFKESTKSDHFQTLGHMIREHVSSNWIHTKERYGASQGKQVYYLSIEFLLGRLLRHNLMNLGIEELVDSGLQELGIDLGDLEEIEADAGLGNGGLGRLAACFLDSLSSLNLPGNGCGIRYRHGLFEQKFVDGYQVELPEQWLRYGQVWEIRKNDLAVEVPFWGEVESYDENSRLAFRHINAEVVTAVPYDLPIIGYHNETVNTLRLWSAEPSPYPFYQDVMKYKRETEAISEFLYPDDTHNEGKILRLKQQYLLVSASLRLIIRNHRFSHRSLADLPKHIAIHINDTHPVMAIPELMRLLLDEEKMGWEEAWDITTQTISYTNHTTLSEALEKWPVQLFKPLLPRIHMIIQEINERFCQELWKLYPGDWDRIGQMSIISHDEIKMAHLALVGSYSVNGVAQIHTNILKNREMNLFYQVFPGKFNNKTNGITHRRWLLKSNPKLSGLITEAIGSEWVSTPEELSKLAVFKEDRGFLDRLQQVKQDNKERFLRRINEQTGIQIDPHSIFDVHVKRLHAYKRQLLNVLHIMHLYSRLKDDSSFEMYPRTFIFGAKASPGYYYAKKIIKLINTVADKINADPAVNDKLKVVFLENYRVSVAEELFPAADVSEQISTASKEASGTGNMKLMMNGAITVGTLDGANVEIKEKVGSDNIFIFGLTAEEVLHFSQVGGYHSMEYYHHDKKIRQVVDQLKNGYFSEVDDEFEPIFDSLLIQNDQYFVLRDFDSYVSIHREVERKYQDREQWIKMSLLNIAGSGYFSSDRTIKEYADRIWKIKPV
ncbi:glycogen/starch/alpha-glucan phosphorylase [Bacillus sp. 1NLA3E]|uniref:glycogen/starch/alpha-glucan phosphorylase n=1 Tax=Bacillus sp. 1NLA3E TaxID=666686 RepID=UPI000247F35F|nr:glycogen/starch/alpha-glucan phosphorylase [Bacillus sp. 1NLA3E]AGK55318.1 glycogen phosphorylase [Bacillus sp. 1NLA3E]